MATMVKEKRRDKRKSKTKESSKNEEEPNKFIANEKPSSNLTGNVFEPTCNVIEVSDVTTEVDNTKDKTTLIVELQCEEACEGISNETQEREPEHIEPSAPVLEQNEAVSYIPPVEVVKNEDIKTKIKCLPLDEAIRLFGGKEIEEVRAISEFEDAKVEGGPQCDPYHPLRDSLSTFSSSLKAVERERNHITNGLLEEEKARASLWKVNKRSVNVTEKCPCGATINFKVTFDVAQLDKERLPAAQMRLESLTLKVEDAYCHHQHIALQTHYDIDEYIYELIQSHKDNIRDALSLVFQCLRLSDGAPEAYVQALQRWSCILSTALLDGDCVMEYLMFFLHNLFRQTRSVQWAGHVFSLQVTDMSSAARLLGVLEAILTHPVIDPAQECSEDTWEEVDDLGEGCAVGEGRLRERDLLTLLNALPLRDLLAKLVLFMRQDISQETDQYWGDNSGGHGVLKSTCGIRTLLHILQKAHDTHSSYARLQRKLKRLAVSALTSLAALHMHSSTNYSTDVEDKVSAELQACFAAGVYLVQEEAHKIPATLLTLEVALEFSGTFFSRLHDDGPVFIETLSLEMPIHSCLLRTRIAAQATLDRELDSDLARLTLENLFQIGIKNTSCKLGCDVVAREILQQLLAVHPRLHTLAFQMFADVSIAENIDPVVLASLSREHWRPSEAEARSILTEWAVKCFDYIQHLLLHLDYTPHTGLSLETQLMIGNWVCEFACRGGETPEWAWQVLRRLSVHRSQWKYPLDAPTHGNPKNLLSMAFTLLASDWGHSLPLICGPGVEALYQLALSRPTDAVHCVSNIMQVMALSPESVSLTPKFTEIFSVILGSGPNLVQRALGRRNSTGQDLLQGLLVLQMKDAKTEPQRCSSLLSAWLHALWKPSLPSSSREVLDIALRICRDWRTLDIHSNMLLQEENAKDYIDDAVRHAASAPLLCESILRISHANEINSQMYARLLEELVKQKVTSQKIHVDNALKAIGMSITDDELVIHRCACAVLLVRMQHPAQILLWRLLMHMFLQRPPAPQPESLPPVGPLFFSGLIKSRILSHLKKRLQETSLFHHAQIKVLKSVECSTASTPTSSVVKASPSGDNDMFPSLAIIDLTGVSSSQSECTLSEDSKDTKAGDTSVEQNIYNFLQYHVGAEKLIREYLLWLEEGEKAHAQAYHADINRFLSEKAIDAAWAASVGIISVNVDTPSVTPTTSTTTTPEQAKPITHLSHCDRAVRAIMSIREVAMKRYKIPALPQPLDDVYFTDSYLLQQTVDKYLNELKQFANDWNNDLCAVTHLDMQLWDYVRKLRVSRPLPAVRKSCSNGCKPITIQIPENEWVVSTGAQQGIQENRRSARAAIRHLSRPRPYVARLTSIVHSMGSRIVHEGSALKVAERGYEITAYTWLYAPAQDAVTALVSNIAQRFISLDSRAASDYLARWMRGNDAQKNLCTYLIAPLRMNPTTWPKLYNTVLTLHLEPHVAFSFLSKFDMATWSHRADTSQRSEVLEYLVKAALRMGPEPNAEEMVLLEILCKHSAAIVQQKEVYAHILRCAHASISCHLPPFYCQHLPEIAIKFSRGVNIDQVAHLLRELGLIFWEARSSTEINREIYSKYAPHFTKTLYNLLKCLLSAASYLSYEPDRVAYYASSALHESFSAWVAPNASPPLIPDSVDAEEFSSVLKLYTDAIIMIMEESPGCSGYVLRYVWEWTVNTFVNVEDGATLGGGLLAQQTLLPWTQPWFHIDCLLLVPKITTTSDQNLRSWCSNVMRHFKTNDWLSGATDDNIANNLLAVLSLLTSKLLVFPPETLEEACKLPWYRLPVPAVENALETYFRDHYTYSLPYHQQPHFRVMLAACQLIIPETESANRSALTSEKRINSISLWMRHATAPALKEHVPEYTLYQLELFTNLAPHIKDCQGELEALIGRAVVIMCMEPAAAVALPVWERWISTCPPKVRRACAAAVATLTTIEYFMVLANAVAKAIMNEKETASWSDISSRWTSCPWWLSSTLLVRKCLHAAYAMLHAHEHSHKDMRHVFRALLNAELDFSENEVMISVWICVAARIIVQNTGSEDEAASSERRECVEAARTLLMRWAEQRRTLLQLVTLHPAGNCPMTQHRVLCRLALCIVSPSDSAARSYESAVTSLLSAPDVLSWSRARQPRTLPRLACRLYPAHEAYFKEEQELVPEDI